MRKKQKDKKHEEHMNETWLIPYSDLLTLLLALFIVLFSMSSIDAHKFQQMAKSFSGVFTGQDQIMDYPNPVPPKESMQTESSKIKKTTSDKQAMLEKTELKVIQNKIDAYIKRNSLQSELKTTLTDEGLLVSILNDALFDSGSAVVRKRDEKLAREVSKLLVMNPPRSIIISGHTDNIPIQNSQFSSNWELSVMRAVNFLKVLLENKQLDPRDFSAKGYGEFSPVASNATPEGRMKNRRVEILILPNK